QWSPQLVAQLQQLGGEAHYPDRLSLPVDHGIRLLALDDIDWIESAGNYLCIRTGNETLILRETLTKMETRLDPKRFARIHRSRIVNLSRVAKLLPLYNGDHTVVLKDSTELGLSRTYRDALYRALGIEH
ncbi:MAG TPA: LytTR family DNA-binding domain-containing protein, partial [Patescibacteria group bacterium]|nr:LytTR family DNA-binding domain-containing protein [Patescibacteria group bacterium]